MVGNRDEMVMDAFLKRGRVTYSLLHDPSFKSDTISPVSASCFTTGRLYHTYLPTYIAGPCVRSECVYTYINAAGSNYCRYYMQPSSTAVE